MIDNTLIERALVLTWKSMEDVTEWVGITIDFFSIEKFFYYLISIEFMIALREKYPYTNFRILNSADLIHAFKKYQIGEEEPLISLLKTIW